MKSCLLNALKSYSLLLTTVAMFGSGLLDSLQFVLHTTHVRIDKKTSHRRAMKCFSRHDTH